MNRKVHVQFGGGRLETQVKLCAGRLPNQYDDRTTNYDIRGQRLDSSFLVNDATDDDNTEPAIAYNSVDAEYLP